MIIGGVRGQEWSLRMRSRLRRGWREYTRPDDRVKARIDTKGRLGVRNVDASVVAVQVEEVARFQRDIGRRPRGRTRR